MKKIIILLLVIVSLSSYGQEDETKYQIDWNPLYGMSLYDNGDYYGLGTELTGQYFYTKNLSFGVNASYKYSNYLYKSNTIAIGPLLRYNLYLKKWSFYGGLAYNFNYSNEGEKTDESVTVQPVDISWSTLKPHLGVNYSFGNWGIYYQANYGYNFGISNSSKTSGNFIHDIGVFFRF